MVSECISSINIVSLYLVWYNYYVRISKQEQLEFDEISNELKNDSNVLKMKDFVQHGSIFTYDHCLDVASLAFHLSKGLKMKADKEVLIKAAMLHDFYLYDWHGSSVNVPLFQMHGFTHANKASENAKQILNVNEKTTNAIKSHMWPLTLRQIPTSKEAWLICLCDKLCATKETIFRR